MKAIFVAILLQVLPFWHTAGDSLGVTTLISARDPYGANLIEGGRLGQVTVSYKVQDGLWQTLKPAKLQDGKYISRGIGDAVVMIQSFTEQADGGFHWNITLENKCPLPVFIGDLAITVPWKAHGDEPQDIFEQSFIKHAFISGDASFLYFTRYNGEAPYIMLIPDRGTPLEYFSSDRPGYRAYIRSAKSGSRETRGTWRQPHTGETLQPGESRDYGFTYMAADGYKQMRQILYESGSIDTKVIPGMTVPCGQKAVFALRTKGDIEAVEAEFPSATNLYLKERKGDTWLYEVTFERLGENELAITFDGGRKTYLEFFCSLSPKELTLKRSAFLTQHQQFRDTGKWYDGLYGVYDMASGELRGPDNPDYFDERLTYFLASDDPILGKAPFVASKNAVWPDQAEIESLEYHLEHFVWGGLQRTDKETPYEYGVYGTPNWYINRHPELRATQTDYKLGTMHTWRTYDYPHVMMLWWEMYKIARDYPQMVHYSSADTLLERAYQTARVYFLYPKELLGEYYEPFKWGCYNELLIPELADELDIKGLHSQADTLRRQWERKVHYFVYEDRYPFRSEYAADRTAFESSYALAKYGMQNGLDPAAMRDFMERQHYANLACRGVLENQWFLLGSDFFVSSDWSAMSYMARMGGWSVLDYGLRYADDPYDWIRLGYSSHLGPFGLVNAGDASSDYGYWYPGVDKDGAMGQAFSPTKFGGTWIGTQEPRGPWRYCGEGDLGMCAITRTACTILADDPLFGWTLYGGELSVLDGVFRFVPEDGVSQRIYLVSDARRIGITLDKGHWSSTDPVTVKADFSTCRLPVVSDGQPVTLTLEALKGRLTPRVRCAGRTLKPTRDRYGRYCYLLPQAQGPQLLEVRF